MPNALPIFIALPSESNPEDVLDIIYCHSGADFLESHYTHPDSIKALFERGDILELRETPTRSISIEDCQIAFHGMKLGTKPYRITTGYKGLTEYIQFFANATQQQVGVYIFSIN